MVIDIGIVSAGRKRVSNRRGHGRKSHCDGHTVGYQWLGFIKSIDANTEEPKEEEQETRDPCHMYLETWSHLLE